VNPATAPETPCLRDLTVIVPVFGQREVLESHIHNHRFLHENCGETLWVATPSADGAHHLARKTARQLGGEYLETPPGLYQAWNLALGKAGKDWIYFNTVGDVCQPLLLNKLIGAAISAGVDVAFSPPERSPRTTAGDLRVWPIFRYARILGSFESRPVPRRMMARLQLLAGDSNLLGSLAGAVFARKYLQRNPFPACFKSFGDTAWSYQNCFTANFLYSSRPVASFLSHDSARPANHPRDTARLLLLLAERLPAPSDALLREKIRHYLIHRRLLNRLRGSRPGKSWIFSPASWIVRFQREKSFFDMTRCFLRSIPRD